MKHQFEPDYLPELVKNFSEGDIIKKHRGVIGIRKILSKKNKPIQEVFESGIVPYLIEISKQT